MSESLKDRYSTKEQMDQYLKAFGVSQQEYEEIQREADKEKAKIDQRIAARRASAAR